MNILACGPFFSETGALVSLFILLIVKPATYFAFIQAFRFRVSRDVPMHARPMSDYVALDGLGNPLGLVQVVLEHQELRTLATATADRPEALGVT